MCDIIVNSYKLPYTVIVGLCPLNNIYEIQDDIYIYNQHHLWGDFTKCCIFDGKIICLYPTRMGISWEIFSHQNRDWSVRNFAIFSIKNGCGMFFLFSIEWGSVTRLLSQMVPIFTFSLGIQRSHGKSGDFTRTYHPVQSSNMAMEHPP